MGASRLLRRVAARFNAGVRPNRGAGALKDAWRLHPANSKARLCGWVPAVQSKGQELLEFHPAGLDQLPGNVLNILLERGSLLGLDLNQGLVHDISGVVNLKLNPDKRADMHPYHSEEGLVFGFGKQPFKTFL